ncbi:MAG: hypothetical protein LBQ24_02555 [Candidatus Peribacteria bacterium]|nr:hypothetical protein [Candidatus Peribacteria bacterium]
MKLIEKIMRQNNCISWELALFINKKLIENNDPTMATSNKVRIQLYRRKK